MTGDIMKRQFSPYEQNQLRKFGISVSDALKHGDMPVEYITGHVEFYGRDFLVNQSVLIPRIETEELAKLAIELSASFPSSFFLRPSSFLLADVGTGSGVLGFTLYLEMIILGKVLTVFRSDGKLLEHVVNELPQVIFE
jgi:release factor glutamine methyltransferase